MKRYSILLAITLFSLLVEAQELRSFKVTISGKGDPIILIPGYSCSAEVWKETVNVLSNQYECHVINIAGYAGIGPIDTPVLRTVRDELIKYTRNKKLRQPVLIGHSLGAFMSLWVSSVEPNLFGKVICVDGLPFISAMYDSTATEEQYRKNPQFDPATVIKAFASIPREGYIEAMSKSMEYQVRDTARAKQIATWSFLGDSKTLATTLIEMSTTDLRKSIASIEKPVLVIGSVYGTEENSFRILEQQYRRLKNKSIKVADSKHFIMYDQFDWMIREIKNFLK